MCGIVGEVAFGGRAVDECWVRDACEIMTHRGPDGQGIYNDGNVVLGHRRLSIIDLAGGAQPLYYDQGKSCITYNGEIYNYRELRTELVQLGYRFTTRSDTEVISAAYAAWGTECLRRLNGIFAFALWDSLSKRLLLARDHLGVKPVLYHHDEHGFRFASELQALLECPSIPKEIDSCGLQDYLSLGYVLCPRTIIKGICKLPPAHYLLLDGEKCEITQYWNLAGFVQAPRLRFSSESEAFEEALIQTLRNRGVSDGQ